MNTIQYKQVKFNALILAGGKSSRMKEPKHKLYYLGNSFLQHAISTLSALSPQRIYISGNDIDGAIPDLIDGIGPIAGIHAVVHQSSLPLIVIPIDTPLLKTADLRALIDEGFRKGVSVTYEGSPLPCFLNDDNQLTNIVDTMIATKSQPKDLSLFSLCHNVNALRLLPIDVDLYSINTPEEYERLIKT